MRQRNRFSPDRSVRRAFRLPVLGAMFAVFFMAACDGGSPGEEPPPDEGRGSIVSTTLIETATKQQLSGIFTSFGVPVAPAFDVEIYRVVYRTIDPQGNETTASGAVMRPKGLTGAMPLVSYQHGTVVARDDVASIGGLDVPETLIGVVFATTGYLAVMPDYLGLGTSEGLHPYVHAASLATAVVDMLRAGRRFAEAEGIDLNDRLFLIGYSEGGFATAAAQRLIEAEHAAEFPLTASAPMAGNYDMSGTMADLMLSREPYPSPFYFPYTLLAYDEVYDLFENLSDAFVPPWDVRLPVLFDGTHDSAQIDAELPAVPLEIARDDYVAAFESDDDHPLRQALRDNDLYAWTPKTPMRMYHCVDDDLVPFANTEVASASFKARGAAAVEVVSLTFGGHQACAAPALLLGKFWFDALRSAKQGPPPDVSGVRLRLTPAF